MSHNFSCPFAEYEAFVEEKILGEIKLREMVEDMEQKEYSLAVIPGDGVGTEVCREAVKVGSAAAQKNGSMLKFEWFNWGCDYYLKHGRMMPEDVLDILSGFDGIFLGCMGDASKVPDHISLGLLLTVRKGFDQYVNLRPIGVFRNARKEST